MLDEFEKLEKSEESTDKTASEINENQNDKNDAANQSAINQETDKPVNIDNKEEPIPDTYNALQEKSKISYERQYNTFLEWCKKKNLTEYTEPVLMQYFTEKSKFYKSSTLWARFSMLRATMNNKLNVNIANYKKLTAFLKKKAIGYKSEKTKIFTRDEVNRFLTEAPDEIYLMMKVF